MSSRKQETFGKRSTIALAVGACAAAFLLLSISPEGRVIDAAATMVDATIGLTLVLAGLHLIVTATRKAARIKVPVKSKARGERRHSGKR